MRLADRLARLPIDTLCSNRRAQEITRALTSGRLREWAKSRERACRMLLKRLAELTLKNEYR